MTAQHDQRKFLKALKSALNSGAINSAAKKAILDEIQSAMEPNDTEVSLRQRFGTPEQLAASYLEDEPARVSSSQHARRWGGRLLAGVGIFFVAVIGLFALIAWYHSRDEFDYANLQAAELAADAPGWQSPTWVPNKVVINQARAVLYWHDHPGFRWRCERDTVPPRDSADSVLTIEQDYCLMVLPRNSAEIDARQASVVMIEPRQDLAVSVRQTSLELALAENTVVTMIEAEKTRVDAFPPSAQPEATIAITSTQSEITRYHY